MNPDDLIERLLMQMQAPPGSPAATVHERFLPMDEALREGTAQTIGMEGGAPPVGMDYFQPIADQASPRGMAAFEESAPESTNVDDRRGEDVMDFIKRYMQSQQPMERLKDFARDDFFEPTPSDQLPVPNFDYKKRSR